MPVTPPSSRYTIEHSGVSTRITIPSRKNWFAIFFLGFWLIGWAVGEVVALGFLVGGLVSLISEGAARLPGVVAGFGGLFVLAWLGGWTVGGAFAVYAFLWQITGKEVIEVSHQSITISRQTLGFSRPKEYLVEHVKDLRVAPLTAYSGFGWSRASSFWGLGEGMIAFDYGSRTFRFGAGADEAEAKQILLEIQRHYPQYGKRDSWTEG